MFTLYTQSGGLVEIISTYSGIYGNQTYLHIDQTANIRNGEDEAAILLSLNECKGMIAMFNDYIKSIEGKDYIKLTDSVAELLEHPDLKEVLENIEEEVQHTGKDFKHCSAKVGKRLRTERLKRQQDNDNRII